MLDHRNLLSHRYDQEFLDEAIAEIESTYMKAINNLHAWFDRQTT